MNFTKDETGNINMRKCIHCGAYNKENAKSCYSCGHSHPFKSLFERIFKK